VFIPLVDILRCVNAHPETWLVASIERHEERDILEGTLGCPTCLAEYPIRDGIVYFDEDPALTAPHSARPAAEAPPSDDDAMRVAAALDLTDPRMTAVLHGRWGEHAVLIRGIAPAQLLLLNPTVPVTSGDGVSIIVSKTAPLAAASIDATAFDAAASAETVSSLVRAVKHGGRVVGPASAIVPPDLSELVRDDEIWVARNDTIPASAPVLPTRRPSQH